MTALLEQPRGARPSMRSGAAVSERRAVVKAVPLASVSVVLLLSAAQQRPSATAAVVIGLTLATVTACMFGAEPRDRAYVALSGPRR